MLLYERLSNDLNKKVKDDQIEKVVISESSKYRPYSFGDNRANACGTIDKTSENFVYTPSRIQPFSKISLGYYHSLGIDKNGALFSWGRDKFN